MGMRNLRLPLGYGHIYINVGIDTLYPYERCPREMYALFLKDPMFSFKTCLELFYMFCYSYFIFVTIHVLNENSSIL